MATQQSQAKTQPRVIRVFVSSTFRDMQAERDELVKFIFPQLRKLCEQRGVTWGEVDLRWGISEEQKSEGKVLSICLDEIRHCRPYFIGMLGERYGWIPDEIPAEMVDREPWLAGHFNHSVTELEILHGVLNNPEMAEHAFFHFRDPRYLDTLSSEQKTACVESDLPEEIRKYGIEEARRRTEQRKQKLAALKKRIKNSGFPVHEDYPDPKQFGHMVLQDLTAIIEELYPEGSQPDPLDHEAAEHEIFARSRANVYIGRREYFDQLDAHANSDGQPLTILGESGSGKSALLANWALNYREQHPDELVLMQFIGATPGSTDWAAMLRRILGEFKRKFEIQEEIPDQPDALRSAFSNWLNIAAARGQVVLILDALNQLEDRDGAPDLVWLPPHIPENVRILLSTLPGRPLEELKKRGWPVLTIEPLLYEERKQLIKEYLKLFTKTLDKDPTDLIASAAQCQNPLFLRVLLDELRQFGIYEDIKPQIKIYLKAPNIPGLYELILKRCEQDYERDRPGMVREAMPLLWAARRGLSEAELMELLGTDGQPLPHAYWSPFYLALEQSFLNRGGVIGFSHDYLRQAVQNRYLPEQSLQKSAHLRLADYFEAQSGESPRRLDELPWHLAQAREWQKLYDLLADLPFFAAVWKTNPFEVKAYWAQIEGNSSLRLVKAYQPVINTPVRYADQVWHIALLLAETGNPVEAQSLQEYLVEHFRQTNDWASLSASLNNQAVILDDRGDLEGAMVLHKEQERICRELGDKAGLQRTLGNQAAIIHTRGDLEEAMALYKEQERISRELGDKAGLGGSLHNQALILADRGDLEGAMVLNKEEERISRELGNMAEDVFFTAFHPKEARVMKWYTLLVYAHLETALVSIRVNAARFKAEMGAPKEAAATQSARIQRGTKITVVPACEGVEFNPERITFEWMESSHRAIFRMKGDASLAGDAGRGVVTIYAGPLIVGTIKLALLFGDNPESAGLPGESDQETSARMYQANEIFVSYSHKDSRVVAACRNTYKALGFSVLIDIDKLRPGQEWNKELMNMIERADIFQLFWSENAEESPYVRQEWQHALNCKKGEGFIRPVYWNLPLTPPPPELSYLHFDYVPLPEQEPSE
jgi:hypothetical protein